MVLPYPKDYDDELINYIDVLNGDYRIPDDLTDTTVFDLSFELVEVKDDNTQQERKL